MIEVSDDPRTHRRAESRRIASPGLLKAHTEACRVLPDRLALLDEIPKHGRIAEVGVAFGDYAAEILARSDPAELHLIDLWTAPRYRDGQAEVRKRFDNEIASGRVQLHIGKSLDCLNELADRSLDFIYIDTTHSYDLTLAELRVASFKVAKGGLLAGHDFCVGNVVEPVIYGVIQACLRFCREDGWRFRYITLDAGGSFSFCLEREP